MAGLGGLPYFLQDMQAARQQAIQQQQAKMQLAAFQQQQQARQQQQAAMSAAGNALPALLAGGQAAAAPQLQAPPAMPPGQASQPSPQPQGVPGLPGTGGGAPPGAVQPPPIPPGGVRGAMPPPGIPPFKPMPTTPPQSATAPQGNIPTPPVSSIQPSATSTDTPGLTLQNAVEALQKQGLKGAELFMGLQQILPVINAQGKAQLQMAQQQFDNQMKIAQLQERYDALKQQSENLRASLEQRAKAHQDYMAIRREMVDISAQNLKMKMQMGDNAKLTPEEASVLGEQLANGDTSVLSNLGRGAQGAANVVAIRKAAIKHAQEQGMSGNDLSANVAQFQGWKAAARTSATKAANIGMAAEEAAQTFPLVRQASAALPRSQFVPANKAIQAAQTGSGDPRVIALGTALNTSINAYARAISPTGNPTVSDKEHARELLSTANTPEQIEAALSVMEKEMSAARKAPGLVQQQQRQRMGGSQAGPKAGTVEGGYRFKGGDPSKQENWEKV